MLVLSSNGYRVFLRKFVENPTTATAVLVDELPVPAFRQEKPGYPRGYPAHKEQATYTH